MSEASETPASALAAAAARQSSALIRRWVWWNFAAISLDVTCWTAGATCVDPGAVLPVFVSTLTRSTLVVATLTILPGVCWTGLQLVGVCQVLHRPRKLPYLLKVAALGRAPMLLIPALLLFAHPSKQLMLGVLVGCFALLYITDGLLGAAWYDMIAKVIPGGLRGRLFATWNILGAVAALAVGWLVRVVLANTHLVYPQQYGVLFACLCAGLGLSYAFLASIREPAGPVSHEQAQPLLRVLAQAPVVWAAAPSLRRLLYITWLGNLASLAWPFYALYGIRALGLSPAAGAVFIWASAAGSMSGSLAWGWVNDWRGPRAVVVGVSMVRAAPPLLALITPLLAPAWPVLTHPGSAQYAYAVIFFFTGLIAGGYSIAFPNYLLEMAPTAERPLYVGMGNTLNAPGLLAPLLGGWLVAHAGYPPVFVIGVVTGLASLVLSLGLERVGGKQAEAPSQ